MLLSPVDENAYHKIDHDEYFKNLLSTTTMREKARMASAPLCDAHDTKVKCLLDYIDLNRPSKSYKDALSLPNAAEWARAYDKEYMGIKQRRVIEAVRIEKEMQFMGMTTCNAYKVVNGEFQKRKSLSTGCVQWETNRSKDLSLTLYAPVLKPAEFRLLVVIGASTNSEVFKYDT